MTRPEEATPLKPRGFGAPRFPEKSQDKFLANEDENAYVQLEVFGDPAPAVEWWQGESNLTSLPRFKSWTDGGRGLVFLGVENAQRSDEGVYRCLISNRFGKREHKFKLFIARSWQDKKGPPKKEVPLYWSDVPRSKFIKEGSTESVTFTAKLTVCDRTAKWYFNDQVCQAGDKYVISQQGGNFTITIKNPSPQDTGCYRCVLDRADLPCETYLEVQVPDPEYYFLKPLPISCSGYKGRPVSFRCISSADAQVVWTRDDKKLEPNSYEAFTDQGEHRLVLPCPAAQHSGLYTCRILKYGRVGGDETSCQLTLLDYPHRFSKHLPPHLNLVERQDLVLQVSTEENDALVTWLKNGREMVLERKRHQRLQLVSKENLHVLRLQNIRQEDGGIYAARTNTETTSCTIQIAEFPHKFLIGLPEVVSVVEDGRAVLEVQVEDPEAEVDWYRNDVKIEAERSRLARVLIHSAGSIRTLTIKKCNIEDDGTITAVTNKDKTSTKLKVKCFNSFLQRLVDTADCCEHSQMTFEVRVKDIHAPVIFFKDRMRLEPEPGRTEQVDLGEGRHQFIINKVHMDDAGLMACKTPSNRGEEMLECKCIFNVSEGESAPVLGKAEAVTCVAILHSYSERMNTYIQKEQCRIVVPYKIEGSRVSTVHISIEKDGKELELGNEIQLRVKTDRLMIDVINPQRCNTGLYKIVMSNREGSSETTVPVTVLDIPSPPRGCDVCNVFKDSVTVTWLPPDDDGGTSIKHYVVDLLDTTTNNMWTTVAMSNTREDREIVIRNLQEGHRYSFRVSAANKIGQSEPCEYRGSDILTKDPWEVPESCGRVQVIDFAPTFADLCWGPPAGDGGSPILSYIIQMKETNMREWVDAVEIPVAEVETEGDSLRGRCENLEEEYEYRFRVMAVNRGGRGEPGPSSLPVIAMHKNIPPTLKGDGLADMTVKEGRPFRFDVWVAGEPAPAIEWFRNELKLTPDDSISISVYAKNSSVYSLKNAVLSIPKAVEDQHSGLYKLRLRNESGVFESVGRVTIEVPPGKKRKEEEEKMKAKEEEEKKRREEEDKRKEEERLAQEALLATLINRKLSEIKANDAKDEDRDSGLKIGEESVVDTEEEGWTEYSEEDEDFYDHEDVATKRTGLEAKEDKGCERSDDITAKRSGSQAQVDMNSENAEDIGTDSTRHANTAAQKMTGGWGEVAEQGIVPVDTKDIHGVYVPPKYADGGQNGWHASGTNVDSQGSADGGNIAGMVDLNAATASWSADWTDAGGHGGFLLERNNCQGSFQASSDVAAVVAHPQQHTSSASNVSHLQSCKESEDDVSGTCRLSGSSSYATVVENSNSGSSFDDAVAGNNAVVRPGRGNESAVSPWINGGSARYLDSSISSQKQVTDETAPRHVTPHHMAQEINHWSGQQGWQNSETEAGQQIKRSQEDGENKWEIKERKQEQGEKETRVQNKEEEQRRIPEEEKERSSHVEEEVTQWRREEEEERRSQVEEEETQWKREEEEERRRQEEENEARQREEEERRRRREEEEARRRQDKEREQREEEERVARRDARFQELSGQLADQLVGLGLMQSPSAPCFLPDNGDGCLISLLDQMNQEGQDFKVWERDDYSFLRWYITRIMETHVIQGNSFKFIDDIPGDPLAYVERISQEFVHVDNVFLQAAATIFNKDILLISPQSTEPLVLWGGPNSTRGKGTPFLFGLIPAVDEIAPQYFSLVLADQGSAPDWLKGYEPGNSLAATATCEASADETVEADVSSQDNLSVSSIDFQQNTAIFNGHADACYDDQPKDHDSNLVEQKTEEETIQVVMRAPGARSWKRMDSYTGCSSRDLDQLLHEIQAETDLQELYAKLDQCDDDNGEQEEGRDDTDHDKVCDGNKDHEEKEEEGQIEGEEYEGEEELEEEEESPIEVDMLEAHKEEKEENRIQENDEINDEEEESQWEEDAEENDDIMIEEHEEEITQEIRNMDSSRIEQWVESEFEGEVENKEDENATAPFEDEHSAEAQTVADNRENNDIDEGAEKEDDEVTLASTRRPLTRTLVRKRIRITATAVPADQHPQKGDSSAHREDAGLEDGSDLVANGCRIPGSEQEISFHNSTSGHDSKDQPVSQVELTVAEDGRPVALVVSPLNGQQTEVQLRQTAAAAPQQLRYQRKNSRASYRWSGQEMYQVDGPPAFTCPENNNISSTEELQSFSDTKDLGAVDLTEADTRAAAEERLAAQMARHGLRASQPAASDCDTCFRALIDQMTQPGQDFPAWDRDDHTFLRWYICKQLEILASSGRGPEYILPGADGDVTTTLASIQAEDCYVDEALLFSFARMFKKDVVVFTGDAVRYLKGGKGAGGSFGRGSPLLLGRTGDSQPIFTSLVAREDTDIEALVRQLRDKAE